MKPFMIAVLATTLMSATANAQQPPLKFKKELTAEQQRFMNQCNPDQKRDVGAACVCLMGGISSVMPLDDYLAIETDVKSGKIEKAEAEQRIGKLNGAYNHFQKCMR